MKPEKVHFEIELLEDNTEFGVVVPDELQEVFSQWPEAAEAFRSLTDGRKRSFIYAIRPCKTPQIWVNKALEACERLVLGVRNSRDLVRSKD